MKLAMAVLMMAGTVASADTISWKGETWDISAGASAAVDGSGNLVLTRGANSEATLHLALPSSINANGTPWVQVSYLDPGRGSNTRNVDFFIDSNQAVHDPRLQAGSLFNFPGLGYTRYDASTERVEFGLGSGRPQGLNTPHSIYAGKQDDGTVNYNFDGTVVSASPFLSDATVGDWGYGTIFLRLRGGTSGDSATFTDFGFGDTPVASALAVPLPSSALGGMALLVIFGVPRIRRAIGGRFGNVGVSA